MEHFVDFEITISDDDGVWSAFTWKDIPSEVADQMAYFASAAADRIFVADEAAAERIVEQAGPA